MEIPPYVVQLRGTTREGKAFNASGVLVDAAGTILTCWHVVNGATKVTAHLSPTRSAPYGDAESHGNDLATLRPSVPLLSTPFADPDLDWRGRVKVGDPVTVWGFSTADYYAGAQHIDATIRGFDERDARIGLTASINPGDSGGALLDERQRLIGIVQVNDPNNEGHGMAVPIHLAPASIFDRRSGAGLPVPASSPNFLGRDDEVVQILEKLHTKRLVTLFGVAGIGKSECARAVARRASSHSWAATGVHYIDLQSATNTAEVAAIIRAAHELVGTAKGPAIGTSLRGPFLHVLDDVQQALTGDAKNLRALLRELHDYSDPARFLVTSRTPLGIPGLETKIPLGRLKPPHDVVLAKQLLRFFGYDMQPGDDDRLRKLLESLDGIPLAMVNATSRMQDPAYTLQKFLKLWEQKRTAALTVPGVGEPDKSTSVDYSLMLTFHGLPDDRTRRLFSTFSLLPAGGTAALFDALFGDDASALVDELVRQTLIEPRDDRYTMLVPLREFAVSTFEHGPPADLVQALDKCLIGLATSACCDEAWIVRRRESAALITTELANLLAAVDRAEKRGDHRAVATLTDSFRSYYAFAMPGEGAEAQLRRSIAAAEKIGEPRLEANLLKALADVYWVIDKHKRARPLLLRAIGIYETLHDDAALADCKWSLGGIHWILEEYEDARKLHEEGLSISRNLDDRRRMARCIQSIGDVDRMEKKYDDARTRYTEALDLFRAASDVVGEAQALRHLGEVSYAQQQYEEALRDYEKSLRLFEESGEQLGAAAAVRSIGDVQRKFGHIDAAYEAYKDALGRFERLGDRYDVAGVLWQMTLCFETKGDLAQAIQKMETVVGIYQQIEVPDVKTAQARLERLRAAAAPPPPEPGAVS